MMPQGAAPIFVVYVGICGTVGMLSCIPVIENVTEKFPLDPALEMYRSTGGSVLVLPMWNDNGACNLRTPFVLPASDLMAFNDHLESRHRLGTLDTIGHGPSHFRSISGLLLFLSNGEAVWVAPGRYPTGNSPDVYWRPGYEGEYGVELIKAMKGWLTSQIDAPPAVLDLVRLMQWCEERKNTIAFLDSLSIPSLTVEFCGWKDVGT